MELDALVPLEAVISTAPLTVRRHVRWTDCDPAGVIFTGRLSDYVLSVGLVFRRFILAGRGPEIEREAGFLTPAKALSLVFESALWPDDLVDIAVYVGAVRSRTIDLLMQASRADNAKPVFRARITSICMQSSGPRAAIAWPDDYRARYVAYHDQHGVPESLKDLGP